MRHLRSLAVPAVIAAVALLFWNSVAVLPLRLFVVMLHELSHALAAWLTGGSVVRIELSAAEGGVALTRGGSQFLILNAGYLGSLVLGALLLVIAARSRFDRFVAALVGGAILAMTILYMRSGFGFAYGMAAGGVLLLLGWKGPEWASDLVLKTLGVVSCLYAVWDVGSDVLARDVPGSDANALAASTGIPAMVWGVGWIAISVGVVGLALRASIVREVKRERERLAPLRK